MSKVRIYELAKEVKVSSKVLLDIIHDMGIEAANHMAGVDSSDVDRIKQVVARKKPVKRQVKPLPVADEATSAVSEVKADTTTTEQVVAAPTTDTELNKKKKIRKKRLVLDENGKPVKKVLKKRLVLDENGKPIKKVRKKRLVLDENGNPIKKVRKSKPAQDGVAEPVASATTDANTATKDLKPVATEPVAAPPKEQAKPVDKTPAATKADSPKQSDVKPADVVESTTDKPADRESANRSDAAKAPVNGQRQSTGSETTPKSNKKSKKRKKDKKRDEQANNNGKKTLTMQRKTRKKRQKKKREKIDEPMIHEELEQSTIQLPNRTTVGDFATLIDKSSNEVILKLMNLGVMAAINQYVDYETMELIAEDFEIEVEQMPETIDEAVIDYDYEDDEDDLEHRAPVVTVMGHVDHGKTSLLDAIRSTNVIEGEAGGITQHIGASEVVVSGQKVVFLDTPGHEAFTSLRARGAQVTDIAILVVAADDGVMPQTIEAIDHARAADVPIIVAVNKIDKPGANPDRVKQELSEQGVIVEDWGGDTICVHVSALKGENIDQLLEMILLVAEMRELKANPDRNAVGTVIEANLDKGKGAVATVLVQNGHLAVGDPFVCGTTYGRVRAMYNSKGKRVKKVGPSTAVEVIGINDVPMAGDKFFAIDSDKEAKQIAEERALEIKQDEMERASGHVTLEDIFNQIQAGRMKELNLIIKADAHGSLEALKGSLAKLNNESDEVNINIQHANIGAITESDIMLATASNTIVLGFNVRPSSSVIAMAKKENIEIKTYRIIYELLNDIESAMKGMLDPEFEEVQLGEIQVRATFKVPNVGTIAGGYVLSGKVLRSSKIRLLREGVIIHEGELSSLKRFKDDVKEVASGYECGLGIASFNDLKEGDIIEAYQIVEKPRK